MQFRRPRHAFAVPGLSGLRSTGDPAMACEPITAAAERATNAVLNFVIFFP